MIKQVRAQLLSRQWLKEIGILRKLILRGLRRDRADSDNWPIWGSEILGGDSRVGGAVFEYKESKG